MFWKPIPRSSSSLLSRLLPKRRPRQVPLRILPPHNVGRTERCVRVSAVNPVSMFWWGLHRAVAKHVEKSLQEAAAVEVAVLERRAAGDESLVNRRRTSRVGQLTGLGIDLHNVHAFRRREGLSTDEVGPQGRRLHHEFGPDGEGRLGAFDLDVAIVVVSDPDNAQHAGGVSGEPGVARAPGLSGGGQGKPAGANAGRGSFVDD